MEQHPPAAVEVPAQAARPSAKATAARTPTIRLIERPPFNEKLFGDSRLDRFGPLFPALGSDGRGTQGIRYKLPGRPKHEQRNRSGQHDEVGDQAVLEVGARDDDEHPEQRVAVLGAEDGVGGREGSFSMCTFWLVEALTRAGKYDNRICFSNIVADNGFNQINFLI
jgi:hypothetical protein